MPLTTKNGVLLVKDGKLQTDCNCCKANPCNCTSSAAPASLLLQISSSAFGVLTGNSSNLYYDDLKSGGSCENDSAIVEWLNGTVIPLSLFSSNPPTQDFVGTATYSGAVSTQGPFGSVEVGCWAVFSCSGGISVEVFWCPAVASGTGCMAYTSRPFQMSGAGTNLCGFSSKALGVSSLFRQLRATQNTASLDMSGFGLGVRTCRGNAGTVASQAVSRYFNATVTLSANALP